MNRNHIYLTISILSSVVLLFSACGKSKKERSFKFGELIEDTLGRNKQLPKFVGNYNLELNDLHDLHMEAAKRLGVPPLAQRADTAQHLESEDLMRIPQNTELFSVDSLQFSTSYLVPEAGRLLAIISRDFRDSLRSRNLPFYRVIVTSITRTDEDVKKLMNRNRNAVPESAHRYGTTFDISWRRFDACPTDSTTQAVSSDRLKFILGQVLFNLRNRGLCYVKHERQQACFHITVR